VLGREDTEDQPLNSELEIKDYMGELKFYISHKYYNLD
jgi:hypothetical protein